MAKLPVISQLSRQDFPDAPAWISKLLYPIQLFMTSVISALTNKLTLQDNMACVIQKFSIVADATDTKNTYSFPFLTNSSPVELTYSCTNADGTYTAVYPQLSWNYINGNIVINGIKGLTAGKKYNFTVTVK